MPLAEEYEMSEKAPSHPEHIKSNEVVAEQVSAEKHVEHQEQSQEHHEVDPAPTIEALKQKAQKEAVSKNEVHIDKSPPAQHQTVINRELKLVALSRTLSQIRRHLSKPDKAFSKVIHQPTIDKLSRISEKTIARPYGILVAGIVALVGSSVLLFAAKHYGFRYNLSVFFILLIAGYLGGLLLEAIVRMVKKRR